MDDALPTRPAGFWIRAVAFAIDAVVCAFVQLSFGAIGRVLLGPSVDGSPARGPAFVFTVIFAAAYWTVLTMMAGQTLGKSIVGVRVVGTDGALLTFGPSLLRYLASGLSLAIFGFGYLMAALRRDKRALHDLIAGSRVERPIAARPGVRRVVRPAPATPVASSTPRESAPSPSASASMAGEPSPMHGVPGSTPVPPSPMPSAPVTTPVAAPPAWTPSSPEPRPSSLQPRPLSPPEPPAPSAAP